ncbi:hypothetical protein F2P81_006359, partial [Scophthalmus maximus]
MEVPRNHKAPAGIYRAEPRLRSSGALSPFTGTRAQRLQEPDKLGDWRGFHDAK